MKDEYSNDLWAAYLYIQALKARIKQLEEKK